MKADWPQHRHLLSILITSIVAPPLYLLYVVGIRTIQSFPVVIDTLLSQSMVLYFFLLAGIAAIGTATRQCGFRVSPVIAFGGFLLWPWSYSTLPIGATGMVAIWFVITAATTFFETILTYSSLIERFLTSKPGHLTVLIGVLHVGAGLALQTYARIFTLNTASLLVYLVSAFGLLLTGILPATLWYRDRLQLPLATLGIWLLWGLSGIYTMRANLPRNGFTEIHWTSLTPYPDYAASWLSLLLVILFTALFEYLLKTPTDSATSVGE